jgi:hypothetical protein
VSSRMIGAAAAPRATVAAAASAGYPTVGKLTFDADGVLGLNCTATVIAGTAAAHHRELILTAAHCIEGTAGGIASATSPEPTAGG